MTPQEMLSKLEDQYDIVDGDYGIQDANQAMVIGQRLEHAMDNSPDEVDEVMDRAKDLFESMNLDQPSFPEVKP